MGQTRQIYAYNQVDLRARQEYDNQDARRRVMGRQMHMHASITITNMRMVSKTIILIIK